MTIKTLLWKFVVLPVVMKPLLFAADLYRMYSKFAGAKDGKQRLLMQAHLVWVAIKRLSL